jgi:hypothetical protein
MGRRGRRFNIAARTASLDAAREQCPYTGSTTGFCPPRSTELPSHSAV